MGDKMKKLMVPIILGVTFVAGFVIYGQVIKYFNFDNNSSIQVMADEADEFITQEEYNLEKSFLEATTPEEKQKAYEALMDYYVRTGELTQEQGESLKKAGYEDDGVYYTVEDSVLELDDMLAEGYITQEEYDLEKVFSEATTPEEKQKAYEALMDYYVRTGELTQEQGESLKKAGYDDSDSDYYFEWDSLSSIEDVMSELDYLLEEGYITQEEYDLEKAILSAGTDEEKQKAFEALIDYCVSEGHLTEEEGKEEKEAGYKEYFDYMYGLEI